MIPISTLTGSAWRPLTRSLTLATSPHRVEVKGIAPTSPLPIGERSEAIVMAEPCSARTYRFRVRGRLSRLWSTDEAPISLSIMDKEPGQ